MSLPIPPSPTGYPSTGASIDPPEGEILPLKLLFILLGFFFGTMSGCDKMMTII
jgi:hypothetical protein